MITNHIKLPRVLISIFTAACLLLATGCGPSGPQKYPVSGEITFDGAPLPDGDIFFVPDDQSLSTERARVSQGRYALEAHPGRNVVKINASRPVPGTSSPGPSGIELPDLEDYIPEKYNQQTSLEAEVERRGNNFDFQLEP